MSDTDHPIRLAETRSSRLEAIQWWNRDRVHHARVLVVGAGALGNEILKNLAMLGVGQVVVVDMDRVEITNLSRSVLFTEQDAGTAKSETAAKKMRVINPEISVWPLFGNVCAHVGLGYFNWADVVVGALDNREARVFINSVCAQVGRPWIDGGIGDLHGIVRGFEPPRTACYECTMSRADWEQIHARRSCSLLERRAMAGGGVPTTPTTASVIGGMQAQEVLKHIHGRDGLWGRAFIFDGLRHTSYTVSYSIDPNCPWHEPPAPIETDARFSSELPLSTLADAGRKSLGGLDALDFSRELVESLECGVCHTQDDVWQPVEALSIAQILCPRCERERIPSFCHSVHPTSEHLARSPRELGLPAWDIIWARRGDSMLGLELAADRPLSSVSGVTGSEDHV